MRPHRLVPLACLVTLAASPRAGAVPASPRAGAVPASPGDQQLALAAAGAIKIVVRADGWQHVGQSALVAAGLPAATDPRKLQLFADGVEQALLVTGNGDGTFAGDEAVEFFGEARDTLSTDARTYWLVVGAAGARVTSVTPPAGAAPPTSFVHTARLVERSVYLSSVRNGEESNFFGAAITPTMTMKTLSVRHLDAGQAAQAKLRVSLQGLTVGAHAIDVSLAGVLLGTATFDGQTRGTFSFAAPSVVEGDDVVTLVAKASSTDYSALAGLELDTPHTYAADGDALRMQAPAGARLTLTGFTTADVRVIDVTDHARPTELAVTTTAAGAVFDARVDVPADAMPHDLYAFTAAHLAAPSAVTGDASSTWAASHDGELLILSHASFLDAMAPLVARRTSEGWSVQLVDLQDVYDEAGFGDKSPAAIRAFIQTARARWRVPPRFVLLVGDATFDPRNFLGKGDFDLAPTKLIDTATMETVSDDWFVDADGDGVPEVAIGRFPARTKADATTIVTKTLAYEGTANLSRGGLFVRDADGIDLDFSTASAAGATKVSDLMPIDTFQHGAATADVLLAKLGAGPFLVNYMGHGSVEVWDGLLSSAQASALTNSHASIYVVMNCLNGFFHDLYTTSLAESLLEAPQGGAVAVWASSTLAEFGPQPAYNQEFLLHLSRTSLGETAIAAKRAITDAESRRTWILFGDPTLFGKPGPVPVVDAGAVDARDASAGADASIQGDAATDESSVDVGMVDAGMVDAGMVDAGAADTLAADAGMADATASDDGSVAPGDATVDAPADHASPGGSGGGCGCEVEGSKPAAPSALALLLAAVVATVRRRRAAPQRRARHARLFGTLALALVSLGWAARAEAIYSYRKAITIDRTRVGNTGAPTTLSNYPLLLDITDNDLRTASNGGNVQSASGFDISFQGADTTTCGGPSTCVFNYEIESFTASTGHVIAWVQIPVLKTVSASANTIIYVKYGDAAISMATQNATGTWDTSFKGVWHLNQASSPQSDSTSTAANATYQGTTPPATATGLIGAGVATSGTTGDGYLDYRKTTFNWTSSDTFTYQGWVKTTDSAGPLFSQRDNGAGNPVIDIAVGYDGAHTAAGKLVTLVRDDSGGTFAFVTGTTSIADGAWHLFTVTRTGGTIETFVDGTSQGTNTNSGASGNITTGAAGSYQHIAKEGNWVQSSYSSADQQYLDGTFDELRISSTIRSTDWIATDYNTQSAPASTFTLGPETLSSCGDGTVIMGEACDDGNIVSGDGCTATCTIESGYGCTGTTPSVCTTTCSDGIVAGSEGCDDGGLVNGDGCSSTCTVETAYSCTGAPSVCKFGRFDYYKTIVVDRTKVGTASAPATLANYPILFSVTDPSLRTIANGGRMRDANAYDMVFRGLDTTACGGPGLCTFPHEIESYDPTTGTLVAWVNIAGLNTQTASTDTSFEILFGNQAISTTSERKTATWNSNFRGVWHLNQDPTVMSAQMTDSTVNANHGTPTSVTAASSAQVGAGVTMDGTASFIAMNGGTTLNTVNAGAFTYSGWIKTTDATGGIFSLRSSTSSQTVIDIMVGRDGMATTANKLMILTRDDSGGGIADVVSTPSISDGAWHLVTATHSGTSVTLYMDATLIGTATTSAGVYTSDVRNIGREGRWVSDNYTTNAEEYLSGTFDEFRASNTARTIDWVTTDYNNQSSPSTFITYTTGSGGEVATSALTNTALAGFDATETCAGTVISWQTTFEVDTLGFNVYRQVGGQRVRLNASPVQGAGVSGGGAHRYTLVDPGSFDAGRTYVIEDVSFSLVSAFYGPVAPISGTACGDTDASPSVAALGRGPGPTPMANGATASDGLPDRAGGCALGGRGSGSATALGLGVLALLARRRRRRQR